MRFSALLITAFLVGGLAASARAQSLADVARQEEERRKNVPVAGKVFTNKDLKTVPEAPPTSDAAAGQGADASGTLNVSGPSPGTKPAGDTKTATLTPSDKGKAQSEQKDEAYWRARMRSLRDNLERNQTLLAALESRLNGLNNDFASRDDPAQRAVLAQEHDKALVELERIRKAVTAGPIEIAAAEEEARQAGVPPGWLR